MSGPTPTVPLEEKLRHADAALALCKAQLKVASDEMEKLALARTAELVASNQVLQAEIIERKRMEIEILEMTQKEQKRFGSQLHDGLCQELAGIVLFTKGLTQKMEKDNRLDIAELMKISVLLDGAISQARDTARGLYPGELEGASLLHRLEELAVNTQNPPDVSCHFHCPESILINANDTATHLYKIAQESISNAIKHGKVRTVDVSLLRQDGHIVLTIADDGIGLTDAAHHSKGIGLKIMKYRAHMIGADFEVIPNKPHGVIVRCIMKDTA